MAGLYLRGLGHALHQPRDLSVAWHPFAEKALREAGRWDHVQTEIASWSSSSSDHVSPPATEGGSSQAKPGLAK